MSLLKIEKRGKTPDIVRENRVFWETQQTLFLFSKNLILISIKKNTLSIIKNNCEKKTETVKTSKKGDITAVFERIFSLD